MGLEVLRVLEVSRGVVLSRGRARYRKCVPYLGSVERGTSRCRWTCTRGPRTRPLVVPRVTGRTEDCTRP